MIINKYHAVEHPSTREWVLIEATAEQRDSTDMESPDVDRQAVPGLPRFPYQGDAQQWAVVLSDAYERGRADQRKGTL